MKKAKAFKPTTPWLAKEMTKAKAERNRWYLLKNAKGDPAVVPAGITYAPWAKAAVQKEKDLVLYGAALGIKQGLLPENLEGWVGNAIWAEGNGVATFRQGGTAMTVKIPLRFLDWVPAPPAIEPEFEMKMAA